MNNNKNKYLVLCTLNTEKEDVLTKYHLDDKNHPWLAEGIIQLTWKIKIIMKLFQKSLGQDNSSLLSRSVVQQ